MRQQNETKGIQIGKEVLKLSLFSEDIVLCVENSKDSTKKLLEHMNSAKEQTVKSMYRNVLHL